MEQIKSQVDGRSGEEGEGGSQEGGRDWDSEVAFMRIVGATFLKV